MVSLVDYYSVARAFLGLSDAGIKAEWGALVVFYGMGDFLVWTLYSHGTAL